MHKKSYGETNVERNVVKKLQMCTQYAQVYTIIGLSIKKKKEMSVFNKYSL